MVPTEAGRQRLTIYPVRFLLYLRIVSVTINYCLVTEVPMEVHQIKHGKHLCAQMTGRLLNS